MTKTSNTGESTMNAPASIEVADQTRAASSAKLARDERDAALRALSGRLAHQMRNPLAAVRAACSGLRSELDDAEQRETLDLTLQEIDKMLGFVTATVHSIPGQNEQPQPIDVSLELADVIHIMCSSQNGADKIAIGETEKLRCLMPRDGFRVAVYGICEHFLSLPGIESLVVDSLVESDRLSLRFTIALGQASKTVRTVGSSHDGLWVQPMGLLVAERFARDFGGRMLRMENSDDELILTLELPLHNV